MNSKKEQKEKENQERLMKAISTLQSVADSTITPRNIRKTVKDSVEILKDASMSLGIRAANAVSVLDEVVQDPNMPSFARTSLWQAISVLETIRD